MRDANKMYEGVCNTTDGSAGPSRTKRMLLNEMEDRLIGACISPFVRLIVVSMSFVLNFVLHVRVCVCVCASACVRACVPL